MKIGCYDPSLHLPRTISGARFLPYPKHFPVFVNVLSTVLLVAAYALWPQAINVKHVLAHPLLCVAGSVVLVLLVIVVHEFAHILFMPGALKHPSTAVLLVTSKFAVCVYTTVQTSWRIQLGATAAPFILLSVVPFALAYSPFQPSGWFGMAAIINASISANDIAMLFFLAARVPSDASDVDSDNKGVFFSRETRE